jgi:hypothetical protein
MKKPPRLREGFFVRATMAEDATSIAQYGRRIEATNNYGVADTDAADQLGSKCFAESKEPEIKVTCTIIDNADGEKGYDIESIQPGETCRFVGYNSGLSNIFRDNMLITNVTYSLNQAIIDVEIIHAGLLDVQSKQGQSIADISSGD